MAIRFTHFYDLLHKMGTLMGGVMVTAAGADILRPIADVLERELTGQGLSWLWALIIWAYIIGGYIASVHLLRKTVLPTWLPTFLHVRLTLFTKISPREADQMGYLFDGSLGDVWYPLGSLRKIDPDFRREALFRFANKIAAERGWRRPFPMPEDQVGWAPPDEQPGTRSAEHAQARQAPPSSTGGQVAAALSALGFQETPSSFEPIKQAYRRKMSQFHPDKFAGERPEVVQTMEETAKRLNAAYTYLERNFMAR